MAMKILIAVSVIACVLAEPPVGDSYSYTDHPSQRSISTQYGAPAFGSRSINQGYSQPSEDYGVPARSIQTRSNIGVSQQYGTPKERTAPSQSYGAPAARGQFDAARDISRQYIPTARSQGFNSQFSTRNTQLSQQYGAPEARNLINNLEEPTQEYGVPALRSMSDTIPVPGIPSDSYGAPLQRSQDIPSEQYGVPGRSFGSNKSPNFRTSVSQTYVAPRSNYAASTRYNSFNARSQSRKISDTYGAPARSLSIQYGVPSTNFRASSYQKSPSETYGAPNERSLSSEYAAPSGGLNAKAFVSSDVYESARSSPSDKYGPPAREAMPSDQYGVPELNSILSSQGYNYARNALDELLNQEPASYDFGYKVNDFESGSDFGHTETRQDNKAEGSYFVVLPDGSKQVVEYEADEHGFKPRISVEPAEGTGYDDNAADLARSGPY
ncbi:pro-resilin-like [Colias croceus]|uniref:pro-resilin-like n=1 Tax=Colias crocea TaxID=72248 RepID=UPI001E27FF79|nr:pro-resilin-like [Colias croceus]